MPPAQFLTAVDSSAYLTPGPPSQDPCKLEHKFQEPEHALPHLLPELRTILAAERRRRALCMDPRSIQTLGENLHIFQFLLALVFGSNSPGRPRTAARRRVLPRRPAVADARAALSLPMTRLGHRWTTHGA